MNKYDVIVIGAGPAGLLAAGRAAEMGGNVLILEKKGQVGRKLLITGKGRCNITNDAFIQEFIKHVYPDGRFLRTAFARFFSKDIIELLKNHGVECTLERGGRYFPATNQSIDVLHALLKWVKGLNVEILVNHPVQELIIEDQTIRGVKAKNKNLYSTNVVLATGGKSYPATGSDGSGYELAKGVGHTIVNPRPSLVPLETKGNIAKQLQGLTLKNVKATVWSNNKKKGEKFGEMLFTHFGLSGPIILTLSRIVVDELHEKNDVKITIDLKPALDEQKLDARLIRELDEHGKKKINNILRHLLPSTLVPVFVNLLALDPAKESHQITAGERKQIRNLLKNFTFGISHARSFKEAIITAGGIPTNEIFPKTMGSKIIKGLFFAGEIIDLDAETGGYNLQVAYSTGWLAGCSCMKKD